MIPTIKDCIKKFHSKEATEKAIKDLIEFHVEAALKKASNSRCINMYNKTWFAQSLEPGTKVLDRVNITVDKEAILNSYSLDNIK